MIHSRGQSDYATALVETPPTGGLTVGRRSTIATSAGPDASAASAASAEPLAANLLQTHPDHRADVPLLIRDDHPILGCSKSLLLLRRAAASHAAVVLRGESGTGKSVLARSLHRLSSRSEKPFLTLSAPTLPDQL